MVKTYIGVLVATYSYFIDSSENGHGFSLEV